MSHLQDERIIITIIRTLEEYLNFNLKIEAHSEAYGPTQNEGLCYEVLQESEFTGDLKGRIFLAMEGYTRLKLLPILADEYRDDFVKTPRADELIGHMMKGFLAIVFDELNRSELSLHHLPPILKDHKMVDLKYSNSRNYMMIFFLKDRANPAYLGRLYIILSLEKIRSFENKSGGEE